MRKILSVALVSLLGMAQAAAVTSCLEVDTPKAGVQSPPGGTAETTDMSTLESGEADSQKWKLASVRVCTDGSRRLNSIRGTAQQVDLNGAGVGAPVTLSNIGANPTSANLCQTLTLDYASGEYLSKISIVADASTARVVTLDTNKGATLTVGTGGSASTEVSFSNDKQPVGFHGISGSRYWQNVGGIVVSPACYKGYDPSLVTTNTDSSAGGAPAKKAEPLSGTNLIIAIVVPVVVVLIIVAVVVGVIVCKKKQAGKPKTEEISITKTRPITPPDTAKGLAKEERLANITDEEDAPKTAGDKADIAI